MIGAQPVLIDFGASIFERRMYDAENGSALQRDVSRRSMGSRLHRLTFGGNPVAVSNTTKFIDLLKRESRRPVVLVVGGAGVALAWSIRYFSRALGAGNKLSRLIVLPFFWIRYLDAFGRGRAAADAASGFFFLGRRAEQAMDPHAMPEYYNRQK